jgi:hypothetical protein
MQLTASRPERPRQQQQSDALAKTFAKKDRNCKFSIFAAGQPNREGAAAERNRRQPVSDTHPVGPEPADPLQLRAGRGAAAIAHPEHEQSATAAPLAERMAQGHISGAMVLALQLQQVAAAPANVENVALHALNAVQRGSTPVLLNQRKAAASDDNHAHLIMKGENKPLTSVISTLNANLVSGQCKRR